MSFSQLVRLTVRGAWVVCCALLLAACTSTSPAKPHTTEPTTQLSAGVMIERFVLTGRMSIRQQDRLDTVKLEWQRESDREVMRFFSPLGGQLAELSATPDGAVLVRGATIERAPDVSALTSRVLGIALNTALLARWVQAIDIENAVVPADEGGARRWTILVEGLRVVEGRSTGRVASRVDATEGDIRVRLVVDEFRALP